MVMEEHIPYAATTRLAQRSDYKRGGDEGSQEEEATEEAAARIEEEAREERGIQGPGSLWEPRNRGFMMQKRGGRPNMLGGTGLGNAKGNGKHGEGKGEQDGNDGWTTKG